MKWLRRYWLQGKNSLLTVFASSPGKRQNLMTMPQLAFAAAGSGEGSVIVPVAANGTIPKNHFRPLSFLQDFFNAITDIQDARLLPTANRLLLQLTNGQPLVFAEYRQGNLLIHTSCRNLDRDGVFAKKLVQACRDTYRKAPRPVNRKNIQFETLGGAAELQETDSLGVTPLPGPHPCGTGCFLAAFLVSGPQRERTGWSRETDQLLHFCLQHVAIRLREINALAALRLNASTDPLTGVYNRRFFHEVLSRESERSNRHHQPLSLIILDIDHFKVINDTFGHLTGDRVLREIGRITRESIRTIDTVCRYGGEEFAIILPQTELEAASLIAERLRTSIAEFPFSTGEERPLVVTASLGVACWHGSGYLSGQGTELIQAADRALYAAKDTGRNRTCTAPESQGPTAGKGRKPVVFVPSAC